MTYILLFMSIMLGDLMIKKTIEARLPDEKEYVFLDGGVRIRKVHNRAGAFGIFQARPDLVKRGSMLILVLLAPFYAFRLRKKGGTGEKAGLSLLLGGGVSNLFDRLHQGYVTDYLNIRPPRRMEKKFPVLRGRRHYYGNLADWCILLGTLLAFTGKRK